MGIAPRSVDEAARVEALRVLGLLDTPAEAAYDRLVRLTARLLDVPIALVGLIDDRRQWYKAKVGLDGEEVDRELSFCTHAIAREESDPFVVEDATLDERFAANPFVTGAPAVRAYAGQPLRGPSGHRVGTLCAIDQRPRRFSTEDLQALGDLAALVEELIARRSIDDVLADLDRTERTQSLVLESLHEGIVLHDGQAVPTQWNRAAERVLRLTSSQLSGAEDRPRGWQLLAADGSRLTEDDHPSHRAARTRRPVREELVGLDLPDGERRWLRVNATPVDDLGIGVISTFADVTDQHRAQQGLRRYHQLFQHANDLITVIDAQGQVLYASPSNERILGYPFGSRHPDGVLGIVHPADREHTAAALLEFIGGLRAAEPFTTRVHTHAGEVRHLECVVANLLDDDDVGGVVITARDVSERQRLSDELAHQASHDHLTGLPNRAALEQQTVRALARAQRDGSRVALCYLDLDRFKGVNDRYGHGVGDELLCAVADRLRAAIRAGDTPARLGGDEFVVLLEPVADADDARTVATRICVALAGDCATTQGPVSCGASVGVALDRPGDSPATLLLRADRALYQAKHDGRGRVHLADG